MDGLRDGGSDFRPGAGKAPFLLEDRELDRALRSLTTLRRHARLRSAPRLREALEKPNYMLDGTQDE